MSHTNAVVCDPRFVSGSHEDMLLKGMLLGGAGDDPAVESWHGERRCSLTSLESEAEDGDRDAEGDMVDADADGEDDWEHQQHQQQQPAVYDQQQQQREDAGEEEVPEDEESEEEKEDDYYEDDEESVDDDDNDGEFVLRTRRRRANTSSAVYPSSYPYVTEGRNLRSRASSSRYNPYPSYAGSSASDNGAASYSEDNNNTSARRRPSTSSPPLSSSSSTFPTRTLTSTNTKTHANRTRSSSSATTTTTLPVPVPNLTKKSRGRRVPTVSSLEDLRSAAASGGKKRQQQQQGAGGAGKGARMYLCDVEGCGKCFARGEHLKRHVRSIHTYEKREFLLLFHFFFLEADEGVYFYLAHTCPYPGCGKDFSRHDNLGQHMRVHKDYVPPKGGA